LPLAHALITSDYQRSLVEAVKGFSASLRQ
jgi:hypothetical protein